MKNNSIESWRKDINRLVTEVQIQMVKSYEKMLKFITS